MRPQSISEKIFWFVMYVAVTGVCVVVFQLGYTLLRMPQSKAIKPVIRLVFETEDGKEHAFATDKIMEFHTVGAKLFFPDGSWCDLKHVLCNNLGPDWIELDGKRF